MDKIIGYIYETMDYEKFKRLPDNRDVRLQRVRKLIASITEKYILNPITVNEAMEVVDGQGRYDARKELGLPIHYYIAEGANSDDCKRMNKYNTVWTAFDFAQSFAKAGKESYIRIIKSCKETGLSLTTTMRLSNHGSRAKKGSDELGMSLFEKGKLNFTEADAKTVMHVKKACDEIIDALQFTGRPNDAFRNGVKVMIETEGYEHDRMIRNCKNSRSTYMQMARLGDQLVEFERIYNKHAKANRKLYFSDYMRNRGSNVRDYEVTYSPYNDTDISTLKEGK